MANEETPEQLPADNDPTTMSDSADAATERPEAGADQESVPEASGESGPQASETTAEEPTAVLAAVEVDAAPGEDPEPAAGEDPEPAATEQLSVVAVEEEAPVDPPTEVIAPVVESEAPTPAEPAEPTATKRSWLGLWSVLLSVLGLAVLPIIGSVLGIVLARLALRRGPAYRVIGGRPLAIVGFWLGTVTLAALVISVATYALVTAFATR
ncbi:MAG: hypothetical protein VW082_11695 [Candidatus Nanopelagicales bacterium]